MRKKEWEENMKNINKKDIKILFNKLKEGDKEALKEIYNKCNKIVYGIAFSILKNRDNSEDIVQIVFMKIMNMSKDLLPIKNEMSWIYSLTKNETLNYIRKQKDLVNIEEAYFLLEEDKEIQKIIEKDSYNNLIKKLPEKDREIISLKILSNMSFREISNLLNMPIGTVQWRYYTSLHSLKLMIGNISMFILTISIFILHRKFEKNKFETNKVADNIETENIYNTNIEENLENIDNAEVEEKIEEYNDVKSNEDFLNIEEDKTPLYNNIIDESTQTIQVDINDNYHNNLDIELLSVSGIFLFFSIIFAIIFFKIQKK